MRGEGVGVAGVGVAVEGLIPTCAGRACTNRHRRSAPAAHPRMRGEGVTTAPGESRIAGSSPHARGGRAGRNEAWAGTGSSPHARGGLSVNEPTSLQERLIPACAGRAGLTTSGAPGGPAHPRMRGEGAARTARGGGVAGSSPHARGGRAVRDAPCGPVRLIPACAGRARCCANPGARRPAHPRMRGEGAVLCQSRCPKTGSSPHARGGLVLRQAQHLRDGLIPACAGRARGRGTASLSRSAHPRMRGEGSLSVSPMDTMCGSSPHARGGLHHLIHHKLDRRLIPACAGRAP